MRNNHSENDELSDQETNDDDDEDEDEDDEDSTEGYSSEEEDGKVTNTNNSKQDNDKDIEGEGHGFKSPLKRLNNTKTSKKGCSVSPRATRTKDPKSKNTKNDRNVPTPKDPTKSSQGRNNSPRLTSVRNSQTTSVPHPRTRRPYMMNCISPLSYVKKRIEERKLMKTTPC